MLISEFEWYNNIELLQKFENGTFRNILKSFSEKGFDNLLGKKIDQISILPEINNNKV